MQGESLQTNQQKKIEGDSTVGTITVMTEHSYTI